MTDHRANDLHRRHPDLVPEPLFPAPKSRQASKRRPLRPAGKASCPACGREVSLSVASVDKRTGRRRLAYREHWRVTNGGASLLCPQSNRLVPAEE